jgi:hypothetical protein
MERDVGELRLNGCSGKGSVETGLVVQRMRTEWRRCDGEAGSVTAGWRLGTEWLQGIRVDRFSEAKGTEQPQWVGLGCACSSVEMDGEAALECDGGEGTWPDGTGPDCFGSRG